MKAGPKKKVKSAKHDVVLGSTNVFADLGFADSDAQLARAQLAQQIGQAIQDRKLTQVQAAALLDIDQPKVSALLRGKLAGFSTDRLMRYLNALGRDIEIVVRPKRGNRHAPTIHVRSARRAS